MSLSETTAEQAALNDAMAAEYVQNCHEVASATEDLHHRNLARMALLHEHAGVEVPVTELLGLKVEILLDLIVGDNQLQRHMVGFAFQQKLAALLSGYEHDHEHGDKE